MSVSEVEVRRRPCRGRALDAARKQQGVLEALNGVLVSGEEAERYHKFSRYGLKNAQDSLLVVQSDDAELVDNERILPADLLRRKQVLFRKRDIRKPEMLHPDEQEREVRARQVALGSRVGCDGLVVLAFVGERVGVGEPGWAEARVDQDGFAARWEGQLTKDEQSRESRTHPKNRRDSSQRLPEKYHSPTAYQLIASSGSCSTISCARRNSRDRRFGMWCMQERWSGRVGRW